MLNSDKNSYSSNFSDTMNGFSETGYFTNSQFNELMDWVDNRYNYKLQIIAEGHFQKTEEKFKITGIIQPQSKLMDFQSIPILSYHIKIGIKSSDRPYMIKIYDKNFTTSKRVQNKQPFYFTKVKIINQFEKIPENQRAFCRDQFFRALTYFERNIAEYEISVIAKGKYYEAGIPVNCTIRGKAQLNRDFKKGIELIDFQAYQDFIEEKDDHSISIQTKSLPLFLKKRKRKDYQFHLFSPEIVLLKLKKKQIKQENMIEVSNLSVSYGKNQVLNNLNMKIAHGEIIGIIGESGAGKSTTVKAMLNQIDFEGEIKILGIDAHEDKRIAPHIGYVPQETSLIYQNFNALENMIHFGRQYDMEEKEITKKAKSILKDLKIAPWMDIPVKNLSGGQKRRVSVAMALIHDPIIIILDEPTSGLDPVTRFSLWQFFERINRLYEITLVVISHYLDEIEYSDKSAIYLKGIGFFDFNSPTNLKKNLPGNGKTIEIKLNSINLRISKFLNEIDGIADVIQRGLKIRILSNRNHEELKNKIESLLFREKVDYLSVDTGIEIDMLDYFAYYSNQLGAGKRKNHNKKDKEGNKHD